MKDVKDEAYCARIGGEAKQIWERADSMSRQVLELLEKR